MVTKTRFIRVVKLIPKVAAKDFKEQGFIRHGGDRILYNRSEKRGLSGCGPWSGPESPILEPRKRMFPQLVDQWNRAKTGFVPGSRD